MKTIIKEPEYMGENRKGWFKVRTILMILAGIFLLAVTGASPEGVTLMGATGAEVIVGSGTTQDIHDTSPNLVDDYVLKKVIQTHPSSFPLDTIMHYMQQQNTPSWEFRAYDTPYLPYRSSFIAAGAVPTPATNIFTLTPATVQFVRNGSLLYLRNIMGADGLNLALMVDNRSATQINVVALNGIAGTAIPVNSEFIIGSIAADELEMAVEKQVPVPQDYGNFNQLFMCMIELGDYASAQQKEVAWGWSDIADYTIKDFRTRRSIDYLLGYGKKTAVGLDNAIKYTTSGIRRQITRTWPNPVTWTDSDFIDFSEYVFVGSNGAGASGSTKKILLAGNGLITGISKTTNIQKQLAAGLTETVFGITFHKIVTNYGTILVTYDALFTQMGLENEGLVLDPEYLVRTNFKGVNDDKIDYKKAGVKRVKAESFSEASAVLLRNRDAHVWITA